MHSLLGRGLTAPQVEQLAQASVGRNIVAGHALMTEGDRPTGLVLLLEGRVEILKRGRDGQQQSLGTTSVPVQAGQTVQLGNPTGLSGTASPSSTQAGGGQPADEDVARE